MTQFEDILETILEEYARRDFEGEFDTWEETDAFVKEKAEVLLAYVEKEPVSEDLEEASINYADNEEYGDDVYFAIKAAFEAGANWQRGKDIKCYFEERKHIVDEAYRIGIEMGKISMKQLMEQDPNLVVKTKEEYDADLAIQYQKGMNGMKALMMKDAITARCFGAQSGDALFSIRLPAKDYLVGSEIKVIIIKEDKA